MCPKKKKIKTMDFWDLHFERSIMQLSSKKFFQNFRLKRRGPNLDLKHN